jgi:hypothetical protein
LYGRVDAAGSLPLLCNTIEAGRPVLYNRRSRKGNHDVKTLKLRLLILSVTLAVGVGAYHLSMEDMMVQTAKAFADSLTPEQRSIAITDFKIRGAREISLRARQQL